MANQSKAPKPSTVWIDADRRRRLIVRSVTPGDAREREVVGEVSAGDRPHHESTGYSCTLTHWASVWRDKAPRWEGTI